VQDAAAAAPPPPPQRLAFKPFVHARLDFFRLRVPALSPALGKLRVRMAGRLVTVCGTVIRVTNPRLHAAERLFECCSSRCMHRFSLPVDAETGATPPLPEECPSGADPPCRSTKFRPVEEHSPALLRDYQELKARGALPEAASAPHGQPCGPSPVDLDPNGGGLAIRSPL
jgi:DNA replicative helicase MCM subunit Mcm2 (Cdc46/Mcm family)